MESAIYMDGKRFIETDFKGAEEGFENIVKQNYKTLFGSKSIYFDIKNKISTKTLGSSIPDGFLFDFTDEEDPKFYLVEVELEEHDFDGHIFPQIKKYITFFKNPKSMNELIGKLHDFIKSNPNVEREFKKYLGNKEIYKTLKDVMENNQNILLIIDENKPQFEETSDTITEWAKFVKVEVLKVFTVDNKNIFVLTPEFEGLDLIGHSDTSSDESEKIEITESFHTADKDKSIISLYEKIKESMTNIDSEIRVNPQKYYISLRKNKNFAYIYLKKKKMWIAVILPYEIGNKIITKHKVHQEGEGVQRFYGYPMFSVMVENEDNFDEIIKALEEAYKQQNK
jgi:predicted transport protein